MYIYKWLYYYICFYFYSNILGYQWLLTIYTYILFAESLIVYISLRCVLSILIYTIYKILE